VLPGRQRVAATMTKPHRIGHAVERPTVMRVTARSRLADGVDRGRVVETSIVNNEDAGRVELQVDGTVAGYLIYDRTAKCCRSSRFTPI
jgi:hypothetical protein